MKLSLVTPTEGYIVVQLQKELEELKTKTGILLTTKQNQDNNMLVYGEVMKSASPAYQVGSSIIFHVVELEAGFEDVEANKEYYFIHERNVIGLYGQT